jgi:hypothetical protein
MRPDDGLTIPPIPTPTSAQLRQLAAAMRVCGGEVMARFAFRIEAHCVDVARMERSLDEQVRNARTAALAEWELPSNVIPHGIFQQKMKLRDKHLEMRRRDVL